MRRDPFERLQELRSRPFNFLSRAQAREGTLLAFEALDAIHAGRRLPAFVELEQIVTNPHALIGFHEWCQQTRRFTLWTREAIDCLATYVRGRGFERIVEVGAGRGDLSWHLEIAGVPVTATDAGPASLESYTLEHYRHLPVEMWENVHQMDWRAAVALLRPDCVLCSWMPPDEDWTPGFRQLPELRELILFWELRGTTGGNSAFRPNESWQPTELIDLEAYLIGRTDEGLPTLGVNQYTKATAFRRVAAEAIFTGI